MLPTHAQSLLGSSLSYGPVYGAGSTPLSSLACSIGENGLGTKYATLGSLANFPNVGTAPTLSKWGIPTVPLLFLVRLCSDHGLVQAMLRSQPVREHEQRHDIRGNNKLDEAYQYS